MIRMSVGAAIFAALFFLGISPAAFAQDVTLTSRDGSINVDGTLMSYDGEFYRVETAYGTLTLDGQGVLCDGPGCPDLEAYVAEFSFAGAASMGEVLLPALIEAYAARRHLRLRRIVRSDADFSFVLSDPGTGHDAARIGFHLSSSSEGFADLLTGEADIAMSVREIRPDELALGQEAGLGDFNQPARARVLALDALVPIVARGNPVTQMKVSDLGAMLSGTMADWPVQGAPILLHAREAGAGISQAVEDKILAPLGLVMSGEATRHATDADMADAVATDPLALGVARYSEMGNAVPVMLEGSCGMPLPVTRRSLKTEDYPFTTPLFLYTPARRLPLFAREFLRYLSTPSAQLVIRRAGFVDQSREVIPLDDQGLRLSNAIASAGPEVPLKELQRMVGLLQGAGRLTTTFRFRGGATGMDTQSAGNVADLARALETGRFDERQLIFVGFSDGDGGWEVNRRIARERAEAVMTAVKGAAITADLSRVKLRALGFGEALPMACDDTEWGKRVNRRVEVWLR